MAKTDNMLRIRQVRSKIGQTAKQRDVLRTLGLRRIGHVVERPDNPAVRGAVRLIGHLVRIEGPAEVAAAAGPVRPKVAAKPLPKAAAEPPQKAAKKKTEATKAAPKKKTKAAAAGGGKTAKKKTTKKKSGKKKSAGGGS